MKDHLNRNVQNIYIAQLIESTSIINTEMNRFYDYSESKKNIPNIHQHLNLLLAYLIMILIYDT